MKHLKTNLPLRNESVTALFMYKFMVMTDYINNHTLTYIIDYLSIHIHPTIKPYDFKNDFLMKSTIYRTISKYTQNASKIIEFSTLIDRYHPAIDSTMHPDKFLLIGVWMEQIII